MPDIYDLYNFEDQFEGTSSAGLKLRLSRAGLNKVQVLTSRDKPIKETPRIELSFSLSQSMTQRTAAAQAVPRQVPNAFEAIFTASVVTTRALDVANAPDHGRIVGLVRYNFSAAAKAFTAENLPFLQVMEMLPEAQSPRVIDQKGQDVTVLTYHVWFAINNGSWEVCPVPEPTPAPVP